MTRLRRLLVRLLAYSGWSLVFMALAIEYGWKDATRLMEVQTTALRRAVE